jgi:hypothetical protein
MTKANLALASLASAIALCYAPIASAQQSNMITVDLSGVSTAVAKNINVDAAQIPTTIQAPVGVAAAACGVDASTLAQQGGTGAPGSCAAKNTSQALDQLIHKELKATQK